MRILNTTYRKTFTALVAASLTATLTGCGNFWQPPSTTPPPSGTPLTIFTNNVEYSLSGVKLATTGVPYQKVAGNYAGPSLNAGETATGGTLEFGVNLSTLAITPISTSGNGYLYLTGLDLGATWQIYNEWTPVGCNTFYESQTANVLYDTTADVTANETYSISCPYEIGESPVPYISQFAIAGSTTPTFTEVASIPLTTAYGSPQLEVLDQNANVVSTMTATSVAPDGVTATFPYPVNSSGNPLPAELYSTALLNENSDSSMSYAGGMGGFFSIGSISTNYPGAFGVAAVNTSTEASVCVTLHIGVHGAVITTCNNSESQASYPIVTLASQNEVSVNGYLLSVGANPTAIVAYGSNTIDSYTITGSGHDSTTTTGTGYALVTNTGGSTVSIIDILNKVVLATINVGNAPAAAVVSPNGSTAYVANYVDGTVSQINLASNTVTATQTVGASPAALDLDASGNVWVGGAGYLTELNPSSLAIMNTTSQSGNITTMAISKALNTAVTTLVANSGGAPSGLIDYGSATSRVSNLALSSGSSTSSSPLASAHAYYISGASSTIATPGQMANGILVSANYGNEFAVSLVPSGFTVQDLSGNYTFMEGSLPSAGRGLAVDPDYGYVYITLPDSNAVVTVPLPNEPTD